MKEFKGTPGPWVVRNRIASIDVQMDGDEIQDIGKIEDAHLITAAPDLAGGTNGCFPWLC